MVAHQELAGLSYNSDAEPLLPLQDVNYAIFCLLFFTTDGTAPTGGMPQGS